MPVIVIDPGHGGMAPIGGSSPNNATGPSGLLEKEVTLDLGLRVASHPLLRQYTVLLTRNADVNIGIVDRAAVARNSGALAFVSIHFNGDANPATQGSESWIGQGTPPICAVLARLVLGRVLAVSQLRNRGVNVSSQLGVINPANHLPSTAHTLLEVSFLTNPPEEQRLRIVDYRDALATAIAEALDEYVRAVVHVAELRLQFRRPAPRKKKAPTRRPKAKKRSRTRKKSA